ncbi:hypothetical protein N4308_15330, partial [Staphylococcus aureus]|uniref:hypothetical protein n=1 Tax=Staphylococcus aureus TaxID=1280 RepID=UPI0021B14A2A|nr:hypothetical protein [Staphylococcus aureus]
MKVQLSHSVKVAIYIYLAIIFITFTSYLVIILYTSMNGHDVSHYVLDSQHTHHGSLTQKHLSLTEISFK